MSCVIYWFGWGWVGVVFGGGDVGPGAGDAGQVSGFVGGDHRAFLQAFDEIAPESIHVETSYGLSVWDPAVAQFGDECFFVGARDLAALEPGVRQLAYERA